MCRLGAARLALLAIALGCCCCLIRPVESGGLFELKIRGFQNPSGEDSAGRCCRGHRSARGSCGAPCATRLRVCLMHYQRVIDERPECTFGETVTPVLGGSSFRLDEQPANVSFSNPIVFPFNFSWPGTFSLVIEAWHELPPEEQVAGASFEERHTLLHRMTKQGWLDAGPEWTHDERHAVLFDYRVQCDRYYYGSKCNIICKGRASRVFGHYECLADGSRRCLPGWAGEYCTEAACLSGCHHEHGFCERPNECRCRAGWKGPFCDVCERYPGCRNGTCSGAWGCDCLEGWGGLFCNQDLNFCTNHRPCKNGGTCYNTGRGSYTCACAAGFTGTDCEIEESGCARRPCMNGGTCRDTGHNFTCVCPRGWTGHRCETAAETCSDRPCQNGGRCSDEPAGYRCRCPRGFKGINCEQRNTFCQQDTCQNGGNCVNEPAGYRCVCPVGFAGRNCETNIDDCAVNPCLNGGTCRDAVNAFRCSCVPGFAGSVCQLNIDDCLTNPCANGGHCHDRVNSFSCSCRAGFIGHDCSVDVDECVGQQCQNGGTCVDRVGDFECRCQPGFVGELCEFEGVVPEWARMAHLPPPAAADETLPTEHVVLITTLSVAVPTLVLVAIVAVACTKYRRRRAAEKEDDEARRQNAANAESARVNNVLHCKVKNVDGLSAAAPAREKQVNVQPACLALLDGGGGEGKETAAVERDSCGAPADDCRPHRTAEASSDTELEDGGYATQV